MTETSPTTMHHRDLFFDSGKTRLSLTATPLITGILYVVIQWLRTGHVEDALFVSLLIAATTVLVAGTKSIRQYIIDRGFSFYAYVMPADDPERGFREFSQLLKSTFQTVPMTVCGLAYGLLVAAAPSVMNLWPNDVLLRGLLTAFLFSVNFATGLAFYGLVKFLIHSVRMGKLVRVDLWRRNNPSTTFLLGAARRISLVASIYVSLSLSSLLFSVFPPTGLVWGYAAFAASLLIWTLALPAYPIARELHRTKQAALADIDDRLQTEFNRMIDEMRRANTPSNSENLDRLAALREKIARMDTTAVKVKSLLTGMWVLVISAVPVVLEFVLPLIGH